MPWPPAPALALLSTSSPLPVGACAIVNHDAPLHFLRRGAHPVDGTGAPPCGGYSQTPALTGAAAPAPLRGRKSHPKVHSTRLAPAASAELRSRDRASACARRRR